MSTAELLERRGIERGKLEDARNFLRLGVELETILEATGLTKKQLEDAGYYLRQAGARAGALASNSIPFLNVVLH